MTKESKYICNLCGETCSTTRDIINSTNTRTIYGLHYNYTGQDSTSYTLKPLWDCNIHICEKCLNGLFLLFKDKLNNKEEKE